MNESCVVFNSKCEGIAINSLPTRGRGNLVLAFYQLCRRLHSIGIAVDATAANHGFGDF